MLEPALQKIVEQLCEDGCSLVNEYIRRIEANDFPDAMRELNGEQQRQVLIELRAIMAVYQRDDG